MNRLLPCALALLAGAAFAEDKPLPAWTFDRDAQGWRTIPGTVTKTAWEDGALNDPKQAATELDEAKKLGISLVELANGEWTDYETAPCQWDWSKLDAVVKEVAARDLKLVACMGGILNIKYDWKVHTPSDVTFSGDFTALLPRYRAYLDRFFGRYGRHVRFFTFHSEACGKYFEQHPPRTPDHAAEEIASFLELAGDRPLAFNEVFTQGSPMAGRGEEAQAGFVRELFAALAKHEKRLAWCTWWCLRDDDPAIWDYLGEYLAGGKGPAATSFRALATCGLLRGDGTAKPATIEWAKGAAALPR